MKPWKAVTVDELRVFFAVTINMGHVRKGTLKDYWSTDPILSNICKHHASEQIPSNFALFIF